MKADIVPKKGNGHAIKKKINSVREFMAEPLTCLWNRSYTIISTIHLQEFLMKWIMYRDK